MVLVVDWNELVYCFDIVVWFGLFGVFVFWGGFYFGLDGGVVVYDVLVEW